MDAVLRHLQRIGPLLESFADLDRVRGKIAALLGASADDIAFCPSTAHGLSLLLRGIDWKPGDRVISFDNEFPDLLYGASWLAAQGVEFVKIPIGDLDAHLDARVRLVMISALNYTSGLRAPLVALRVKLDAVGALLYVDGTQGCGALSLDVREFQPDLLAVHGYKWMLSPTGAGFVYVRPSTREWLPPNIIGWRSHVGWRDFAKLHEGVPQLSAAAERYEGGMPALPLYYAMEQSLNLMLELGPGAIEQRVLALSERLRAGVIALGGSVAHENTPLLACRFPGRDASDLVQALAAQKIVVAARQGMLRVSIHLYNNEDDIEHFLRVMRELLPA